MSLANFHDVRLPLSLAFGARGGPERRTEIVALASGGEVRNALWAGSRRRWDIGGAVTKLGPLNDLISFFEARRGPLHGFRFRDVFDDRSGRPGAEVTPLDQPLGIGDGETQVFQLLKMYGDTERIIRKPVAGSAVISVDGTAVTGDVETDPMTGRVTFANAPLPGSVLRAGFIFDCPVRFETDRLETSLEAYGVGQAASVPIIELLG